jgi:hypothetical protein
MKKWKATDCGHILHMQDKDGNTQFAMSKLLQRHIGKTESPSATKQTPRKQNQSVEA